LLGDTIPLILDGGPCTVGVESTVCALTEQQAVILRPGGVPVEALEAVIGPVTFASPIQADTRSPGTLLSHYAPHVTLRLLAPDEPIPHVSENERVGLLLFKPRSRIAGYAATEILSQDGNLTEAAANLFAALRRLDAAGLDHVIVEPVPEHGLGRAIMDRLRRAATPD
jgi:L-threonylcarbamoyladenylate synthase